VAAGVSSAQWFASLRRSSLLASSTHPRNDSAGPPEPEIDPAIGSPGSSSKTTRALFDALIGRSLRRGAAARIGNRYQSLEAGSDPTAYVFRMGPGPTRPTDGRLVERDGELGELDRALAGAGAGAGWLVLLEGPAGIGKTALLDAARDRAGHAGVAVSGARGSELEGGFPYGVVRQLLEPAVRAAHGPGRRRLLSGAAALAVPALVGPPAAAADPGEQAFAVVHGLYWLVANLATEAPLALLIDDLHWADAPSLRFLVYLARRLEGLPATVIASVRTGDSGPDQGLVDGLEASPGAQVVSLAALSESGVASVLDAVFGRAPEPGFARSCHRATGGNPFFVRQLAEALIADGIEPIVGATAHISATAPLTIARITLARLGRLSEHAVGLARAIAVLGRDARLPRAAAIAHLDEPHALAALDALIAADVLSTSDWLEFRHPIVHAAIYGELPPGARSAGHRQAAALLQAQGADLDSVAAHLLRSEPVGAADTIATLRDAAAHALTLGAPDSAAAYLRRALEEGPERELRTSVLLELGLAEKLARQPAAAARFEEVGRLTADPVMRATAFLEQAGMIALTGDWPRTLTPLDNALGDLADRDQAIAVRVESIRGARSAYDPEFVDDFRERLPRLRKLVAGGGPGTRALAMLLANWGARHDEPIDRVLALVERGWEEGKYLAERESIELLPHGISALILCEQLDRASEIVEAVRAAGRASGSVMHYLVASIHDALIETQRGNLTAAAADLRGSVERGIEFGLHVPVAVTLSYCTEVLLERPDVADLATLLETIELGPWADALIGAMVIATRGRLRFAAGKRAAAIADLRRAGAINDALHCTNAAQMASWRSALALMLTPPERDEALALAGAELADARRIGQRRRIGVALRVLGMLERGDDAGRAHLEEAVSVLADSPARLEHARTLVELGAALRRHGDRAAARAPVRKGLDLAAHCGAIRLTERARIELAATGARPRRERVTGRDALTPSELRVARMAAEGRTSQDIAQALFVTTKTIDAHLNHSYSKLGINSRKQLAAALAGERG
jgi:DNA-binding CsgD family transcriptional regulator